jgi:hypothetical protein
MNLSHHIGLLGWARVYIYSDIVDFLKSCRTDPVIGLVLIAIGVEPEYRSISRSLSGWGPKGEPNAPIIAESEMTDLLRLLKLIWQPDMSMLAIGVEPDYRSITRSLSEWGLKGEPNALITAESEVTNFLMLLQLIWRLDSSMIAITAGSEVTDFLRLLKLIWRSDSSMIAITAGSEVTDFCYGWRYHAASFRLDVLYWLDLNKFLLRWCHVACWSLNTHRFWSVSPDLSCRFVPAVRLCWSLDWSGVCLDEEEPYFIVIDLLIVEYLMEELIASWLLILQASLFGSQWGLTRIIG